MTHDNTEPFTVLYRAQDGRGGARWPGCQLVSGTECDWWAVGCMMWRKIASETSEEGDDMVKEVVNDRQGAGRCDERRARPRVGVWRRHPRRREAPGQEDGDKKRCTEKDRY